MRFAHPSTGTILGAVALFVALGGTAVAAAPTVVNIADPTTPTQMASVDATGHLKVGDGAGPLTVDGSVQLAAPGAFFHSTTTNLSHLSGCVKVATPATGKALIIRDVRINVIADPTPGNGQFVDLHTGPFCNILVADVNPATIGETVLPFDPGLAIANGNSLWAEATSSVAAEVYVDGYSVPAAQVPASVTHVGGGAQRQ
jgi:hypothetical protein